MAYDFDYTCMVNHVIKYKLIWLNIFDYKDFVITIYRYHISISTAMPVKIHVTAIRCYLNIRDVFCR